MPETIQQPTFHNSSDDLPDVDTEVLVYTGYAFVLAGHDEDGMWRNSDTNQIIFNVTHWTHLPEPPTAQD